MKHTSTTNSDFIMRDSVSTIISPLSISDVLGRQISKTVLLERIQKDTSLYETYLSFPPHLRDEFLLFCQGAKGLKVTYDPFFRKILNPYEHPERLEFFLQTILEQPVKIKKILPREGTQLTEKGSLVIMDILVSLADDSIVNVEMQKIGYAFPAERSECYISDMTMRQYSRVRKELGKSFTFHDMKPVFLIVLMEQSPAVFVTSSGKYIHKRQISYDTGISLKSLHNICYINLDIFQKNIHNITNDTESWLTFLSSEQPADILHLVEYHPIFAEMYHDMAMFRLDVKEVIHMYSEALSIIDRNTANYMIEELQKELEEKQNALEEKQNALEEKQNTIKIKDAQIAELEKQLAALKKN